MSPIPTPLQARHRAAANEHLPDVRIIIGDDERRRGIDEFVRGKTVLQR